MLTRESRIANTNYSVYPQLSYLPLGFKNTISACLISYQPNQKLDWTVTTGPVEIREIKTSIDVYHCCAAFGTEERNWSQESYLVSHIW